VGRYDEAATYFDAAVRESTARADLHHLSAAHINRAVLGFARKDVPQIFEDLTRGSQLARETGEPTLEWCALQNCGEVAYAQGEFEQADEYVKAAYAIAHQVWGDTNREIGNCELLMARIALHRGAFAEARELLSRIRRRTEQLVPGQVSELALFPSEQVMFDMVELATRDATVEEWNAFEERWRSTEMQPMEQVDILDSHALAELRAGRALEGRKLFERALELSEQNPNLVSERVARNFARAFSVASAS
jgi:tetratricopeptide (TPR) repeat protein